MTALDKVFLLGSITGTINGILDNYKQSAQQKLNSLNNLLIELNNATQELRYKLIDLEHSWGNPENDPVKYYQLLNEYQKKAQDLKTKVDKVNTVLSRANIHNATVDKNVKNLDLSMAGLLALPFMQMLNKKLKDKFTKLKAIRTEAKLEKARQSKIRQEESDDKVEDSDTAESDSDKADNTESEDDSDTSDDNPAETALEDAEQQYEKEVFNTEHQIETEQQYADDSSEQLEDIAEQMVNDGEGAGEAAGEAAGDAAAETAEEIGSEIIADF